MPGQLFEKYQSLLGKPNGRPVGVRDGQGKQPNVPYSPALAGMKHTVEGVRSSLLGGDTEGGNYNTEKPSPLSNVSQPSTLAGAQKSAMQKNARQSKDQTSVGKEVEVLNSWLAMFNK
jgi:hypothetical protein